MRFPDKPKMNAKLILTKSYKKPSSQFPVSNNKDVFLALGACCSPLGPANSLFVPGLVWKDFCFGLSTG